jgi:hypothetical protein
VLQNSKYFFHKIVKILNVLYLLIKQIKMFLSSSQNQNYMLSAQQVIDNAKPVLVIVEKGFDLVHIKGKSGGRWAEAHYYTTLELTGEEGTNCNGGDDGEVSYVTGVH